MSSEPDWAEWLERTRFEGLEDEERAALARGLEATRDRVLASARLAEGDDVLDLGAGTGLLTFGARARIGDGWVYAVDPSVPALETLLRAAHGADVAGVMYMIGDAEVIPLPDGAVDVCVTRLVLMYVSDLALASREVHRVLRPGGRLSLYEPVNRKGSFIATAVDWSPLGEELAARVRDEWDSYAAASPLMRLDEEQLAAQLCAAGFADVDVETEQAEDRWLVDAGSVDRRLDRVGAAGQPSLRQRWQQAFEPDEVQALVAHLHTLEGQMLVFARPQAWITARKP